MNRSLTIIGLAVMTYGCSAHAAPSAAALFPIRALSAPRIPASPPTIGGCQVFPSDNPWNTNISSYPVDPNSATYLQHMNAGTTFLHPDFGTNLHYGIPYVVVPKSQPFVPMKFFLYPGQSDPGPYPYPRNASIEGGPHSNGDRHVSVIDSGNCHLYETYRSFYVGPGWRAGNGAVFDFSSNALRPDGWTSADAAGLPIFAGLARYDEAASGAIDHALRMTVHQTQEGFIHPATHWASTTKDPGYPPMGLRVRLKASFDVSKYTGAARVILVAMQNYGMLVADNGSDWYFTGASDIRWDDANLNTLKTVPASAFEVVQTGIIQH
ncbi:MAG TPA: hypothetical protein VID24_11075 [Candidatus Eremiobacteraceae bacterium]